MKMKWKEITFVLTMFGSLLGPSALFGQWWLFGAFAIFGVIFGFWEWFAVVKTGMTVSQHFWAFSKNNKGKAITILGGMIFGWGALIWHLASKMFGG